MTYDKSFQIDEVMAEGYRPSTEDILRTRIVTSGIFEINFTIGVSTYKLIFVRGYHCGARINPVFHGCLQLKFEKKRTLL